MASNLRSLKLCFLEPIKSANSVVLEEETAERKKQKRQWRCMDSCCWTIGYLCTTWWLMLFLYHCLPANLPGLKTLDPPGARLRRGAAAALHPVILVPGIVIGGLQLWQGRPCSEGLVGRRLSGGSFTEIFKRPMCWLEHLSLDNETELDPPGIRVRPVPGLAAADYFAHGYFVWAVLIENWERSGYEDKNMYMASYDWRLSFQNAEKRASLFNGNSQQLNTPCGNVWTEYDEINQESIWRTTETKAYTAQTLFDLLHFISPKMMKRAEAHFSHEIAEDLNDPNYSHYKYWLNPLETKPLVDMREDLTAGV